MMRLVVDSREQTPFTFAGYDAEVQAGALTVGDYSLFGLTDRVAVERKSLPDLVLCLGRERERFERELQRAAALSAFMVVVEAPWGDLASGNYRSQLNPNSARQSVLAFTCRYRVPFMFAGTRAEAERMTFDYLRHYLRSARERLKTLLRAHGDVPENGQQKVTLAY